MDFAILLVLFGAGCVCGFLAGYFGVGGGVVLVPILLYIFPEMIGISGLVATHLALGTSLLVTALTSLSAGYRHYKNGNVVLQAVWLIGMSSVVAALAGSWLAASLPAKTLRQIFATILALAAVRLLTESSRDNKGGKITAQRGGFVFTGIGAGFVSALSGVGGGILAVPMLHHVMHFPIMKAVGTSSATIVVTALAGTIGYIFSGLGNQDMARYPFTLGFVDYLHSLPVIAGAIPLAGIGANAANRTPGDRLRRFFAILLLAVSAKVFFF